MIPTCSQGAPQSFLKSTPMSQFKPPHIHQVVLRKPRSTKGRTGISQSLRNAQTALNGFEVYGVGSLNV